MDLAIAAHRYLSAQPIISQLVEEGLLGSDSKYPQWVFRSDDGNPPRPIEGSGKCAIVLSANSYWALQNAHNTAQFPILRVVIWADNSRDALGMVRSQDASDKCKDIYTRINPLFHDPGKNITYMDSVRIHDMIAGGVFQIQEAVNTEGNTVFGQIMYNISTD